MRTRGLLVTLGTFLSLAVVPSIGAAAPVGDVTEYTAGLSAGSFPAAVTAGVDGNVWFSDRGTQGAVIRATTSGASTELSTGINAGASPRVIAQGPDGNLWVADGGTSPGIVRITPTGTITEFGLPAGSSPDGVVAGPDGDVWFMDRGTRPALGRITPQGAITTWPLPNAGASPHAITVGPDGNLWFADPGKTPAIGEVVIGTTVTVTELSTGLIAGSLPDAIVPGPDGNLWFTDIGTTKAVGRITTDGTITEFSSGLNTGGQPRGITPGPDGNLWFTDQAPGAGAIGKITTGGAITEYPTGTGTVPFRIATGPDGNLWFSDMGATKAIGRFGVGAPAALVTPVTVAGGGAEGAAQSCSGAVWSSWANTQPSSSRFPFDGYQWLLDGAAIPGATAATYTPIPGDVGHQLGCRLTVTYALFTVTEQSTSATVTVLGAAAQLVELQAAANAAGPGGRGLAARVVLARAFLALGQRRLACVTLTTFVTEARAEAGRTIPPGTAASLIASARRIENVLGC